MLFFQFHVILVYSRSTVMINNNINIAEQGAPLIQILAK